jgi:uncharacterized protein
VLHCNTQKTTMKLQPDKSDVQIIGAYGPGWVTISSIREGVALSEKVQRSVVIGSRGERLDWTPESFAQLEVAHFEQLAQLGPELVIFGSGAKLRFTHPSLADSLMRARIGMETMDTLAACRTYNILAGEGRHVIAALLIEAG